MESEGRDTVAGLPRTITGLRERSPMPCRSHSPLWRGLSERCWREPTRACFGYYRSRDGVDGRRCPVEEYRRYLTQETGIPCHVAENPMLCTALAGEALQHLPILRRRWPRSESF